MLDRGVRLRPVPEMGVCLAYTPSRPALHRLNATSWLIASLCDGRPYTEIAAALRAALGGKCVDAHLQTGVAQLLALGVLRAEPEAPGARADGGEDP